MNRQEHWDRIHSAQPAEKLSWYSLHLNTSLELIERACASPNAAIIDVGGGESTLIDDLLARGYQNLTVLDISPTSIETSKRRLGKVAERVQWMVGDVTKVDLEPSRFDLWHDRAVFHFLTSQNDRAAYVRQAARAVRIGGHVVVATFGLKGPARCSGLDVVRYDADSLRFQFGEGFRLLESSTEMHRTPSRTTQQFLYCCWRRE